jgi:hypothetical protein
MNMGREGKISKISKGWNPATALYWERYSRAYIKNSRNAKFIPGQEEKEGSILWRY